MTKIQPSTDNRLFWIAAAAIVVFVYFFGLTVPLLGPDEPRYSQVAREMFERGDWVTPTLGGFHWFEKPALLYWLQIAAYNIFGVSEFSARFGSALFGIGTIASLWLLGKRTGGREFANWLALIAASSLGLIVFSRGASFDIILTFPITAAMVCFFLYDLVRIEKEPGGLGWLIGFYFFIGVALLAKGLVGIVFPFAIAGFYLLLSRRLPNWALLLSVFWGAALAAAVAATWYLPMYLRNGWEFIDEFFIQHHFQRYTSNKYLHPQPFHFFFWALPLMTIPWLPFFLIGIWKFGRRFLLGPEISRVSDGASNRENVGDVGRGDTPDGAGRPLHRSAFSASSSASALLTFAAAWLLVPLLFFTFSGSKLPGYILPAVPPAIVITALYITEFVRGGARRAALLKSLAMATFVVVVGVILFALPNFADVDSVKGLMEAAARRGHRSEKVLTLHTISHNAEFYAPGRLLRDAEGRQRRLLGPTDVSQQLKTAGSDGVLVLVPLEYLHQLTNNAEFDSEVIRDNGELAIVHVRGR